MNSLRRFKCVCLLPQTRNRQDRLAGYWPTSTAYTNLAPPTGLPESPDNNLLPDRWRQAWEPRLRHLDINFEKAKLPRYRMDP